MTNDENDIEEDDPPPPVVWHLTPASNMESIQREGLTAAFGNYASEDKNNAARFVTFSRHLHKDWIAIEIRTDGLDFERSYDHSPAFFGTEDSWVCFDPVPPSHIVNYYEVTFGQEP